MGHKSISQWTRAIRWNDHRLFWFFDDVYGENFYLIWPVNNRQRKKFLLEKFGADLSHEPDDLIFDGKCTEWIPNSGQRNGGQIIALRDWRADPFWIGLLSHECLHAANHVLSRRDVHFANDENASNEPYAYYLTFIVKECVRGLQSIRRR
jgi:hypothetical protein